MNKNITDISKSFGSSGEHILLSGGQGTTYKTENTILKPTTNIAESEELALILENLPESKQLSLPTPVKSVNGSWVENGYVAWNYLEGTEMEGRYEDKLKICDLFCDIFKYIEKPKFIEERADAWSIADKVTWNEITIRYDKDFLPMVKTIQSRLKPNTLPQQIIHGDIGGGNIIFSKKYGFGVIDITLYWRPADYSKALLITDAITWEGGSLDLYELIKNLPDINQLILRAGLRRILEQHEHIKNGKDKTEALTEAQRYLETLTGLNLI